MNRMTFVVALAAGLAGGVISRYISPAPVLAQQGPNAAPVEIRAERFVLVYPNGTVAGTFTTAPQPTNGMLGLEPAIRLLDPKGREIWRVGGNPVRPLAMK